MAKGDHITVTTETLTLGVAADQNGRKVEYEWTKESGLQLFEARLTTRGGTILHRLYVPVSEIRGIEIKIKE